MSRTYKDVREEYKNPEYGWHFGKIKTDMFRYIDLPGAKTKKKRNIDIEDRWMSTPMWWIRIYMNQPQRARGKAWEKKAIKVSLSELEDLDKPSVSRKPHIYYW